MLLNEIPILQSKIEEQMQAEDVISMNDDLISRRVMLGSAFACGGGNSNDACSPGEIVTTTYIPISPCSNSSDSFLSSTSSMSQRTNNSDSAEGDFQSPIIDNGHIKRPMNPFMLWSQQERKRIIQESPDCHNAQISKRLGVTWRTLSDEEKRPFVERAAQLKADHKMLYPNYKFQPKKRKRRQVDSMLAAAAATMPKQIATQMISETSVLSNQSPYYVSSSLPSSHHHLLNAESSNSSTSTIDSGVGESGHSTPVKATSVSQLQNMFSAHSVSINHPQSASSAVGDNSGGTFAVPRPQASASQPPPRKRYALRITISNNQVTNATRQQIDIPLTTLPDGSLTTAEGFNIPQTNPPINNQRELPPSIQCPPAFRMIPVKVVGTQQQQQQEVPRHLQLVQQQQPMPQQLIIQQQPVTAVEQQHPSQQVFLLQPNTVIGSSIPATLQVQQPAVKNSTPIMLRAAMSEPMTRMKTFEMSNDLNSITDVISMPENFDCSEIPFDCLMTPPGSVSPTTGTLTTEDQIAPSLFDMQSGGGPLMEAVL